jgi:hypothetical protein
MVTALALYTGRTIHEFELVGLSTDERLVSRMLELLAEHDAQLFQKAGYQKRPRRAPLRVVSKEGEETGR